MSAMEGQWSITAPVRFALVVSRFNESISSLLLTGAHGTLVRLGIDARAIDTIWVPGAFEIPGVVRRIYHQYDAVITLGAIIRGETAHFDYVAGSATQGVASLAHLGEKPIIFGILTCNTMEEAQARAGGKAGNKGSEAAVSAIEMLTLYQNLSGA